jgi:hypothetical protein
MFSQADYAARWGDLVISKSDEPRFEGLVVDVDPITRLFTVEAEDGRTMIAHPNMLIVKRAGRRR